MDEQKSEVDKIQEFDVETFKKIVYPKPSDWSWLEKNKKAAVKSDRPTLHNYEKIDEVIRVG